MPWTPFDAPIFAALGNSLFPFEQKGNYQAADAALPGPFDGAASDSADRYRTAIACAWLAALSGAPRKALTLLDAPGELRDVDAGQGLAGVVARGLASQFAFNLAPGFSWNGALENQRHWNRFEFAERQDREFNECAQRLDAEHSDVLALVYALWNGLTQIPAPLYPSFYRREQGQPPLDVGLAGLAGSLQQGRFNHDPALLAAVQYMIADRGYREGRTQFSAQMLQVAFQNYSRVGDESGAAACLMFFADKRVAPLTGVEAMNCMLTEGATFSSRNVSDESREYRCDPNAIQLALDDYKAAESRFERAGSGRGLAAIQLRYGFVAGLKGEWPKSAAHCQKALELYVQCGDTMHSALARTHVAFANIALHPGLIDAAGADMIGAWGKTEGSFSYALALGILMGRMGWQTVIRSGDSARAMACFRWCRRLYDALEAGFNVAQAVADQGTIASMRGDRLAAAASFEEALEINNQLSAPSPKFASRVSRQSSGLALGLYQAAERMAEPDSIDYAIQELKRYCCDQRASTPEIRERMLAAAATLREGREKLSSGRFVSDDLAETARAEEQFSRSAELTVTQQAIELGTVAALCYRAKQALERGDSAAAEKYFAAGMQAADEARVCSPLFLSTLVLAHQKRNDEAAAIYRQFLEQEQSSPGADAVMVDVQVNQFDAPEQAPIAERRKHLQAANMFAGLGQWRDAKSELEAIETASAPGWWKDEDDPWTVLGIYGETYEGLGDYPAAGRFFGDAVALLEQRRQSLRSDAERIAFAGIASVRAAYSGPARVALRRLLDQPEHAQELEAALIQYAQQSRSRALSDLLTAPEGESLEQLGQSRRLAAANANLVLWRTLQSEVRQSTEGAGHDGEKRATTLRLHHLAVDAEDDIYRTELETLQAGRDPSQSVPRPSVTLETIAEMLPEDTAILEYLTTQDELFAWAITRKGIADRAVLRAAKSDLGGRIAEFQRLCSSSESAGEWQSALRFYDVAQASEILERIRRAGRNLATLLLDPVKGALERYRRLVIVPHGHAHHLAFHSLQWEGGSLLDGHAVSYLPSTSLLVNGHANGQPAHRLDPGNVMVVACSQRTRFEPRFEGEQLRVERWCPDLRGRDFPALPWAAVEAAEVAKIYPGSTLLKNESLTRERFYEHFRDTAVVHAATHGLALMRIPQLSSILLPEGEQITVHEIARGRLRTDLLVLSACYTGSGMLTQSDEVLGFERALLAAGARRLVLSLWEANDLSTTLLMRQFHRSYANGASAAESLRTAQLWLRDRAARDIVGDLTGIAGEGAGKARDFFGEFDAKQKPFEHPFFWAPFTCVARDLS